MFHEPEQNGGEQNARHRQKNARDESEGEVGMYGAAHFVVFFRAEIAGDDDAGAHGGAVEKADHEKNQIARRRHGGKGVPAQKPPDDDGVGGVVELLKKIA